MPSTSKIKSRMKSITSTQKITKAMKLVSLSKLQQYKVKMANFNEYYEALHGSVDQFLDFEASDPTLPSLYLIFMPDLGLCSAYIQGLRRKLLEFVRSSDIVVSIGTQSYDTLKSYNFLVLNDELSSEHFDLEEIHTMIHGYMNSHRIIAIVPEYRGMTLEFKFDVLNTNYKDPRDEVIYVPDFKTSADMLMDQALLAMIQNTYYLSKVSEHTTRRIAMEKATDSAQDMLDDLSRKYNRIRQEAITQEIAEIVSGMEAM